jgi:acetyl esterase/lipase
MPKFIAIIAAIVLSGCQGALFLGLNAVDDASGAGRKAGIAYAPDHGLHLDLYPAASSESAPVVVFFYGGSWRSGHRAWYRFVGLRLAEAGIVTIIPDYRAFPHVVFPDFMHDAAGAVAWTLSHVEAHGGDPSRVYLMGHSAGAHIAALLATDPRYLEAAGVAREHIKGVIGLSGPYDFLPLTSRQLEEIFPHEAARPQSQPVTFADSRSPPMLLIHGADDNTVWPRNSQRLAALLQEHQVAVDLHVFPGVGHAGTLLALSSVRRQPPVLDLVLRFISERD